MNLSLVKNRTRAIKTLPGFNKKTHRIPDEVSDWSEKLAAELTEEEVKAELNEVYKKLRKELSLRRAEMKVSQEQGTGAIDTPYFQYSIVVSINPDNPAEIIWRQQVTDIRDQIQVLSEPFANVFKDVFVSVEYRPVEPINIDDLIDRIEELEDDRIELNYDIDATDCSMEIEGVDGEIAIAEELISLTQKGGVSPKDLLQAFLDMHELMGEMSFG